jgi:hypothetical protein
MRYRKFLSCEAMKMMSEIADAVAEESSQSP